MVKYPEFVDESQLFGGERLKLHYIPLEHAVFGMKTLRNMQYQILLKVSRIMGLGLRQNGIKI